MPPVPVISPITIIQLTIPRQRDINATDINDNGQVVGHFTDAEGRQHGFVYDAGAFTAIDCPGAARTRAHGINNLAEIVGTFEDANQKTHGFAYNSGQFSPAIDCPGAGLSEVWGINDYGFVVGSGRKIGNDGQAFVYNFGKYTLLNDPNTGVQQPTTDFRDINDGGQIVGFFWGAPEINHGVCYLFHAGVFGPAMDYPYAATPREGGTVFQGINNRGQIVGNFFDLATPTPFVYDAGTCYQLVIPGATTAWISGINDNGQVVGTFKDASGAHGYIAALAL